MKGLLFFLGLVGIAIAASNHELWNEFKEKHGKTYKSLREEQLRFNIFTSNLKRIEEHNEKYNTGESTYFMGITKFADMTQEEFSDSLQGLDISDIREPTEDISFPTAPLPSTFDWRKAGVVTEVKNQEDCGSSWAFSVVGVLEALYAFKFNKTINFSSQQLVDCGESFSFALRGCSGGQTWPALMYINYTGGLSTDSDYPYTAEDGSCRKNATKQFHFPIEDIVVLPKNETVLQQALVTVGPISVGINARFMQLYQGGIFEHDPCLYSLGHAALLVGYGTENNTDYWTLKNTWGTDWGEDGYIRMRRNVGLCGIAEYNIYAVLNW